MKRPKIFVINGTGGCGKDTFVEMVQEEWFKRDRQCQKAYLYGFRAKNTILNLSTIDHTKEVARYFGYTGGKSEEDRKFLSALKSICSEYNDGPYQHMKKVLDENLKRNWVRAIFVHCREIEEIKRFVEDYDAETIFVWNPNVTDILSNPSDAQVKNYNYKIFIDNSGTLEELQELVKLFVDVELE